MINTRSQRARNNSIEMSGMDRYSDTESEGSIPEVLSREQRIEFNNGDLIKSSNNTEINTFIQRFCEMNKPNRSVI